MKVVVFNGSPGNQGNTTVVIWMVFELLKEEGVETELIHIGGTMVYGVLSMCKE